MVNSKSIRTSLEELKTYESSVNPDFPKTILIELTNSCNHRCIFCTHRKMTRPVGSLDRSLLKKILEEAFLLGSNEVGFSMTGEPFLAKDLDTCVALTKKIGFKYIRVSTNGSLATPKRVVPVLEAGLDSIKFSLNAGSAETYEVIHGRNDFNIVLDNLRFISDYRKLFGKPSNIFVSYILTRQNQEELENLKSLISPLVDDILVSSVSNQGGTMYEVNTNLVIKGSKLVTDPPCSIVFNRVHITWEGYLSACCADFQNYLAIADLNRISVEEAWSSLTFKEIRRKHLLNQLEGTLCYNCLNNKDSVVQPLVPKYSTNWR